MAIPVISEITPAMRKVWSRKQPQRDDRVGGLPGRDQPGRAERQRGGTQAGDHRRGPGVGGAAPAGEQHQADHRAAEQDHARIVDARPALRPGQVQHHAGDDQRDGANGQVDVEDPPPGQVVYQEPAERPDHRGQPEDGSDQPLVPAPLPRANHVPDDRLRADDQPARARPLHRAERDQLVHRMMVGSAVATIVWSSAASSMPSISAEKISRT
jgi:hypothetical protein